MSDTTVPLFVDSGANAIRDDAPTIERDAITAILFNPRAKTYLGLRWKEVAWETLVTGGIEEGQSAEEAARAEIREETGYLNIKLVQVLPRYDSKFFHHPKGVNRYAHFQCFLFELVDESKEQISDAEQKKHTPVWLTKEDMEHFNLPEGHRFVFNKAIER